MNKKKLKRIIKYIFYCAVGVVGVYSICVVLLAIDILRPHDFEMNYENKTLYYSNTNLIVDEDVTACKKIYNKLYINAGLGFWVIDLKNKEFKILHTQNATYLSQDNRINNGISYKQEEFGDKLSILNSLGQLSIDEQRIYYALNNRQGEGIIYPDEHLRSQYYGPFYQPIDYLICLFNTIGN